MTVQWTVAEHETQRLKEFLKEKGISRRIIGRTKFHGGSFLVNGAEVRVREMLEPGDHVQLNLPVEEPNPALAATDAPLDILYEDDYFLFINKPVDLISVPSPAHRGDTVASRVKHYLMKQDYRHQVVHVVTRLDRYTSGVMLLAKNTLAHSMMGKLMEEQTLEKYYLALVEGHLEKETDFIDAPIARSEDSIIERRVHESGKPSLTEFQLVERLSNDLSLIRLTLHTGRTHQIRVHMSHIGHPLAGDDLYGGSLAYMDRQALHCCQLKFTHPFSGEEIDISAPMPLDMQKIVDS